MELNGVLWRGKTFLEFLFLAFVPGFAATSDTDGYDCISFSLRRSGLFYVNVHCYVLAAGSSCWYQILVMFCIQFTSGGSQKVIMCTC